MRLVVQRVSAAEVVSDGELTGSIGQGLMVLVGFGQGDGADEVAWGVRKTAGLRVFADERGHLNRSLAQVGGGVLAVPNFTLYGDCTKGRRPHFLAALPADEAAPLFDDYVAGLKKEGLAVGAGVFGAHMAVTLTNDGPVTLILDSADTRS